MFPKHEIYKFTGCHLHVFSIKKDVIPIPNTNEIYLGKFIQMEPLIHNNKIIQNGKATFQYGSIHFSQFSQIHICTQNVKVYENTFEPIFTYESLYAK